MGETLDALQRLQAVELKTTAIRRAIESKVRLVEIKRRNLRRAEEKLRENQLAARERQMKLDALNLDIAVREESVQKHREALNRAKTNKEYSAILAAMNTEKADNARQEGDALKWMEDVQTLTNTHAEIEAERNKLAEEVAAADSAAAAYEQECRGELDQLQATRNEFAAKIAAGALSVFERVAERHEGEALAAVVKPFPKREEYSCSGCNLKVPIEVVNALRTRDELQLCKTCGRILFLEPPRSVK